MVVNGIQIVLGSFVLQNKVLIMTEDYSNNFLDILVSTKVTETENYLYEDNNCQSKDVLTKSKSVLNYDGSAYLLETISRIINKSK